MKELLKEKMSAFSTEKDSNIVEIKTLKYLILISLVTIPFAAILRNLYLDLEKIVVTAIIAEVLMFIAFLFHLKNRYDLSRLLTIIAIASILFGLVFQNIHFNYMWVALFPLVSFILYSYNTAVIFSSIFLFAFLFLDFGISRVPFWMKLFYLQEISTFYLFMVLGGYFYSKTLKEHETVMQYFATRDMLTGALNRHKFLEFLSHEFEKSKRFNLPLSLIMFDIDFFKKVNDTYGHDAGDMVLKRVVEIVKNNIRKIDKLVRWGGEEFIILAPNTDVKGAVCLAEKLREEIEKADFGKIGKITASFGVAGMADGDTVDDLLKRVDEALYKAKQKGRNRVEIN
ncbi:GGDEF domain-containing protein [Desulfurobacterium atlanticum]|uniref:diguanylate cyclase n=1 Tax=Desulfurobacterium atlanticum TaxID=240169 RepID=A0A239A9C3_9BACT|nr:GGDEF domain-containing protein [Desulfurobacterium atlanticum]SNR91483.1 diguanylate cyclase (GGDEF) domain-containing protein [Desulfurobacterium atlanticum]